MQSEVSAEGNEIRARRAGLEALSQPQVSGVSLSFTDTELLSSFWLLILP